VNKFFSLVFALNFSYMINTEIPKVPIVKYVGYLSQKKEVGEDGDYYLMQSDSSMVEVNDSTVVKYKLSLGKILDSFLINETDIIGYYYKPDFVRAVKDSVINDLSVFKFDLLDGKDRPLNGIVDSVFVTSGEDTLSYKLFRIHDKHQRLFKEIGDKVLD
jgi:hypothetical protein